MNKSVIQMSEKKSPSKSTNRQGAKGKTAKTAKTLKSKKTKICKGVTKEGNLCKYKVCKDGGYKYCKKHKKLLEELNDEENDVKRCTSRRACFPDEPDKKGIKATIPITSKYDHCDSCRERERKQEQSLRQIKCKEGTKIQKKNPDIRICPDCPKETVHHVNKMGRKNDGSESKYCIKHLKVRRSVEQNRKPRNRQSQIAEI